MSHIDIHSLKYKGLIPVSKLMEQLRKHKGPITASTIKRAAGVPIEDAPKVIFELKHRGLLRHIETDTPQIQHQLECT